METLFRPSRTLFEAMTRNWLCLSIHPKAKHSTMFVHNVAYSKFLVLIPLTVYKSIQGQWQVCSIQQHITRPADDMLLNRKESLKLPKLAIVGLMTRSNVSVYC